MVEAREGIGNLLRAGTEQSAAAKAKISAQKKVFWANRRIKQAEAKIQGLQEQLAEETDAKKIEYLLREVSASRTVIKQTQWQLEETSTLEAVKLSQVIVSRCGGCGWSREGRLDEVTAQFKSHDCTAAA